MIKTYGQYIIGFFIGSNIYIALVASAVCWSGLILFKTANSVPIIAFVFLATQTSYNIQRFFKWKKNVGHKFLEPFIPHNQTLWLTLILVTGIGAFALLFYLSWQQNLLLFLISLITGSYLFVNPLTKKLSGIRYIPYLKTFIVSFCWTGLFFTTTVKDNHAAFFFENIYYWIAVFLEIWQACILFDLRDVSTDKHELKTFANSISLSWMIVLWSLITCTILFLLLTKSNYNYMLCVYAPIALIQLYAMIKKPKQLIFTFLVDGSLILFAVLNYYAFINA